MQIETISYYLPDRILDNYSLAKEFPEWNAEKISEKIGIKNRHIAADNETALDLAYKASDLVLKNIEISKIDFILLCTQSPDYYLPTSACILQDKLGLRKNIGALDFNLGCSGYIYGLALSKGLIDAQIANNILLVTAETYSKHIHPKDKSNLSIFGDAATATILSRSVQEHIFNFELGTDGSGMNNLIVKNGGLRSRFDPSLVDHFDNSGAILNSNYLYMNGPEIFNFTIENIPGLIEKTLISNNTTIEEIDYFIFHQANKFMLDYLRKKTKISENKFHNNMENTGNTVSSTIPIALKDCLDNGILKYGDKVLLAGFGVGYSWGAVIITI